MNSVSLYRKWFRVQNNIIVFLAVLCVYFSYYGLFGERSLATLKDLDMKLSAAEQQLDAQEAAVEHLEARVKALRPGSVDKDLLEERARYMLGYRSKNEWDVL